MVGGSGGDIDKEKVFQEETFPKGDPDRSKRTLLRERKPNSKYGEYYIIEDGVFKAKKANRGVTKETSNAAEEIQQSSSRKKKPIPKHCESGLNEEIIPQRNKRVAMHKRNQNTKYKENVEVDDVNSHLSEEKEDSEGVDHDARWASEENVQVSSRKRRASMKYTEDGDYSFSAMEEQGNFPVEKDSPRIGRNSRKKPSIDNRNSLISQKLKRSIGTKITGVDRAKCSCEANAQTRNDAESETIVRVTNGASYKDKKTKEDYTPTVVTLFFDDIDSVPSKSDLHDTFDAYGPLIKKHTQIKKSLRRTRVVFKRRADAENAYKSTERFNTFGPSLVNYSLAYFYRPEWK